jgi:hypothetical protein
VCRFPYSRATTESAISPADPARSRWFESYLVARARWRRGFALSLALRLLARIVLLDLAIFFIGGSDLKRSAGTLSRRPPSQQSSPLQATGNRTEGGAEIGADQRKCRDGRDGDQGGDQSVLDCRNAACIPNQPEHCPAFTFVVYLVQ